MAEAAPTVVVLAGPNGAGKTTSARTADKVVEYLRNGMTEEVLDMLAKVPGLRVAGRSSCFAFKGGTEGDIIARRYLIAMVFVASDKISSNGWRCIDNWHSCGIDFRHERLESPRSDAGLPRESQPQ